MGPPTPAGGEEEFAHYKELIDPTTGKAVTDNTTLTALYNARSGVSPSSDRLLQNLTGISEPAMPCGRISGTGGRPVDLFQSGSGVTGTVTFNRLLTVPTLRLECDFVGLKRQRTVHNPPTAVLEFHFSRYADKPLKNFTQSRSTIDGREMLLLSFTSTGATCSGMSILHGLKDKMTASQKEIFQRLETLAWPREAEDLIFRVDPNACGRYRSDELKHILSRLPGGSGKRLVSLDKPEYSAFARHQGNPLELDCAVKPITLMREKMPMTRLPCGDVISSVNVAVTEMRHAALMAEAEWRVKLQKWADVLHQGTLFRVGTYAVLSTNFSEFETLGDNGQKARFKLPKELSVKMKFAVPGKLEQEYEGYLESDAVGLPSHDAHFVLTSHNAAFFKDGAVDPTEKGKTWVYKSVDFRPHMNSFTLNSNMQTVGQLGNTCLPPEARVRLWQKILLNQSNHELPMVNLLEGHGIPKAEIEEAKAWLYGWKKWNAEQLEVLKTIERSPGRMNIILGVAGTGKTLLQQALTTFFCKLNFRCLVVAPANSNSNKIVKDMVVTYKKDPGQATKIGKVNAAIDAAEEEEIRRRFEDLGITGRPSERVAAGQRKIRVTRFFSASRNQGLKQMSEQQIPHKTTGHTNKQLSTIKSLQFKLAANRDSKVSAARDYALEQAVIDAAAEGKLELHRRLREGAEPVNVWKVFRDHLLAVVEETFDWSNSDLRHEYERCWEWCKNYIIADTDVAVTTTGNARAHEIAEVWLSAANDFPECHQQCRGYIVFIDEACKDQEINVWNTILTPGNRVVGVYMFGDEKQLAPTNTCSQGKTEFNLFNSRINIALPMRLVREGFPFTRLHVQQRMHPVLSKFPNDEFYNGRLQDAEAVEGVTLEDVKPGFVKQVSPSIIDLDLSEAEKKIDPGYADKLCRLHYFEVKGDVSFSENRSKVVKNHVRAFFEEIFPKLQKQFGEETYDNLMIICGYGYAIHHYKNAIHDLQTTQGKGDSFYPRVLTIDSAQGEESFMVVLDGSLQYRNFQGFMSDRGRCNVAFTRAKGVLWFIGGSLDWMPDTWAWKKRENPQWSETPFVKYKSMMEANGQVSKLDLS